MTVYQQRIRTRCARCEGEYSQAPKKELITSVAPSMKTLRARSSEQLRKACENRGQPDGRRRASQQAHHGSRNGGLNGALASGGLEGDGVRSEDKQLVDRAVFEVNGCLMRSVFSEDARCRSKDEQMRCEASSATGDQVDFPPPVTPRAMRAMTSFLRFQSNCERGRRVSNSNWGGGRR